MVLGPVEAAQLQGVRYHSDCGCAACPMHYDHADACNCTAFSGQGSLCQRHADFACLEIRASSIDGVGVFAKGPKSSKNRTKSLVFPKGAVIGYYGGRYTDNYEANVQREYTGPKFDTYRMAVEDHENRFADVPPRTPFDLRFSKRTFGDTEEMETRLGRPRDTGTLHKVMEWSIDGSETTSSMVRYANDPIGTEYESNASFVDGTFTLERSQLQRLLHGSVVYHGDCKILFNPFALQRFLSHRHNYVPVPPQSSYMNIQYQFALPGIGLVASRNIYDGEEILVSYGDGYWAEEQDVMEQ